MEMNQRENEITFTGKGKGNIPQNILDDIPDVPGIIMKSKFFEKSITQCMDVDEANNLQDKNLEEKVALCFPVNSVWQRKEFKQRITQLGTTNYFHWTCDSSKNFQCRKYGMPRRSKDTNSSNSVKCNCQWKIVTTNLWTYPPRDGGKERTFWSQSKPSQQEIQTMWIAVTKIPQEPHNHSLDKETYQETAQKCGIITKELDEKSLFVHNCLLSRHRNGYLKNEVIRTYGEASTPNFVTWSSNECNNWKKKIERLYKHMSPEQFQTQTAFESNFLSKNIQNMFKDDDGDAEYTDIVSQQSRVELMKFYQDSLNNGESDNKTQSEIREWFERLKTRDPYFDYELMVNSEGTIIGMVWMTGQMRRDLEENGSYLMLDFMKKEKNVILYPYTSTVMFRPSGQLCLASEGFFFTESTETYKFLCDATFRMSHKRTKADVYAVAGDEFLDQDKVNNTLGFVNARFLMDQFHLVQVNLCNKFSGAANFKQLEGFIYKWINALTQNEFEVRFTELLFQMGCLKCTSSEINAVHNLYQKKDYFACYRLRSYKGTLSRKGNPGSESNHASVSKTLPSNSLLEIPHMQMILTDRQKTWNYEMKLKFQTEERQLNLLNRSAPNNMLKEASSCTEGMSLCLKGYEYFREQCELSIELEIKSTDSNGNITFNDDICCKLGEECPCEYRQADMIQCCHEIKRYGKFDVGCFDRRYIYHTHPWRRRIPRNGVDVGDENMEQNTQKESAVSDVGDENMERNKQKERIDSVMEVNDESKESSISPQQRQAFLYNDIMDVCKDVASSISNNNNYIFRQKAVGVINAIGHIAKHGSKSVETSSLDEILRSFIHSERGDMESSMAIDPSKRDTSYKPLSKRPCFRSEVMNGSTSLSKSNKRKTLNTVDRHIPATNLKPTCTFCNDLSCKNKRALSCPKLLNYGGTIITRSVDDNRDVQNRALVEELRNGYICPPSNAENAPVGILGRGSSRQAKHFILHSIHKKQGLDERGYLVFQDPSNVHILVTALDCNGDKHRLCEKKLVEAHDFMYFARERGQSRFIIDRRKSDSIGHIPRNQITTAAVLQNVQNSNAQYLLNPLIHYQAAGSFSQLHDIHSMSQLHSSQLLFPGTHHFNSCTMFPMSQEHHSQTLQNEMLTSSTQNESNASSKEKTNNTKSNDR